MKTLAAILLLFGLFWLLRRRSGELVRETDTRNALNYDPPAAFTGTVAYPITTLVPAPYYDQATYRENAQYYMGTVYPVRYDTGSYYRWVPEFCSTEPGHDDPYAACGPSGIIEIVEWTYGAVIERFSATLDVPWYDFNEFLEQILGIPRPLVPA